MKKLSLYNIQAIAIVSILFSFMFMSACNDDEDEGTNEVTLISFGPSQLLAGDDLTFIGTKLNEVNAVVLPGNVEITDFATHTSTKIVFALPEGIADGFVTLKHSGEDIVSTTPLGVARPIEINSFAPAEIKPGGTVTLSGNFLDLVGELVFSSGKSVTDFASQSKTAIEVVVPMDAETGVVEAIYVPEESWKDPEVVESDVELMVSLPGVTSLSPTTIKPGADLTISGTDLDLTTKVIFTGGSIIEAADFVSGSATSIVVTVPDNVQAGALTLVAPSFIEITTSALSLVEPVITNAAPTTIGLNDDLTIDGTDLDLVTSVTFEDGSTGSISSQTETQIVVTLTSTVVDGPYTLNIASGNTIVGGALSIIVPTIDATGGVLPLSVNTLNGPETITITGTRLEDISGASFVGEESNEQWGADVTILSDTQLTISVTQGSMSGAVTLYTTNGETISSTESLTIVPDVPVITDIPSAVLIGQILTITGTNLNVLSDIYFPGDVLATRFASKSSTLIEAEVPETVAEGTGPVKFVTYANEIFRTDDVFFKLPGVEPIKEGSLIIMDFDEEGHDLTWDNWKGAFELTSSGAGPGISDNGNYANGVGSVSSWDWVLACNHAELHKHGPVVAADYELKLDVFVGVADADAVLGFRISEGSGGDVELTGMVSETTPAWATFTYDISGLGTINPDGAQNTNWGFTITGGDFDFTGFKVDNIRFSPKD
ncbi:MAG: hypothetical protein JXR07_19645 [Reichenbachiella sp.]